MLVVLAIAALAILACVVLVSLGRGGELTEFPPDVPPLALPEPGQLTAVDVMALQLPVNLVGYHTQSVDETLRRAATALSARDTRIAVLEQRVSELLANRLQARQEACAGPGQGPRTEHRPEPPNGRLELSDDQPAGEFDPLDEQAPEEAAQDTTESEPDHTVTNADKSVEPAATQPSTTEPDTVEPDTDAPAAQTAPAASPSGTSPSPSPSTYTQRASSGGGRSDREAESDSGSSGGGFSDD
ncbi:hypothetical protein [Nonomuraea sp. NPDC046570]|uniref:hypothetical protein n=1 Tax=Nonomuraea sp. NPDC046570 TaxID=3155255 RepID=UPI0033C7F96F